MFQFFAPGRLFRGLACVLVAGTFAATAAGQFAQPERARARPKLKVPAPANPWQGLDNMEEINQWWDNAGGPVGNLPHGFPTAKTVRAMEDMGTGTTAAVLMVGGLVVLLLGLYFFKRLARANKRRSVLDDPSVRAYMLALEVTNAPAKKAQEVPAAPYLPTRAAPSTAIKV